MINYQSISNFKLKIKNSKAFTLLELLVVIAIISLLVAGAAVSYSQFVKQARDAKRKADLDNIRAALEQYRSVNDVYPTSAAAPGLPFGSGPLNDQKSPANTYMGLVPQDPKSSTANYYYYFPLGGTDYTLATHLEGTSSCTTSPPQGGSATSCSSTDGICNYCLGAYGPK